MLAMIVLPLLFNSCAMQREVEIYREKQDKLERFVHPKHTVRDGLFSKDRKLKYDTDTSTKIVTVNGTSDLLLIILTSFTTRELVG